MTRWTNEQLEAIKKDGQNIIVSAGAGSGKTAVLSERVINKLNKGIHINELLILTFTRAAAEEMKDRIRKKIKKEPSLAHELSLLESSYITTFDSFALSVLKRYHYLLNFPKDIQITDDSIVSLQKKKLLDELFLEYYKKDDENFNKFVLKYCVKNDSLLRENIMQLIDKLDNLLQKERIFEYIKNDYFNEQNINKHVSSFWNLIEFKKNNLKREMELLTLYFDESYNQKLFEVTSHLFNASSLNEFSTVSKFSLPTVPRGTDEEAREAKNNFKKHLDELIKYTEFGDEETIKQNILSTKDEIMLILELVEEYFLRLKNYKVKNQIFTFNDVASYAISILKNHENVREELKNSFKEIMIDEYQDTNDIQEMFISLIADNNVYMVGDIKQSIYRFRGSNPNIFKDKYDNYSKNIGGYKIDLIKNFRSREEVLDGINRIFDLIMDDFLGGAAYSVSHEMVFGNITYLDERMQDYNYDFEVLEYENDKNINFTNSEIEIFTIAKDIKTKMEQKTLVFDKEASQMRPIKYSDFVIILDRSKYFDDFKRIFEFLDIPLSILKDGSLVSSIDIPLIKNLIDFLIRVKTNDFGFDFKYDFMSIGRSFLYEYTDEYLFDMITDNKITSTSLYSDFNSIENFSSKTCEELYRDILDVTSFYNKIYKIGDYENINVRLSTVSDLAKNLSSMGKTIIDFRDYLNEILESGYDIKYTMFNDSTDSVKILTIHKSKGLEYPICYFADLDHNFNTSELKDKFIFDRNLGFILSAENDEEENILKSIYRDNFNKDEISEKIRLFYVALTRAREKMIIVLPSNDDINYHKDENGTIDTSKRLSFKSLSDIIYATKKYLLKHFSKINLDEIGLTKNYLYKKEIGQIKTNVDIDNFIVENINIQESHLQEKEFSKKTAEVISKNSYENMKFGTEIHEIFEYLDFKNPDLSMISDEFIKGKVIKFLNNEVMVNSKNATIYHEYEFIYQNDETIYHGIIDLMLEYTDKIDIIDFKLKNTNDANYVKQLNGYKAYIESISNKPVSIYLYSILDEKMNSLN